ncbi:MAG TPA: response regulator transcription factor [Lacunisphaera sp.]|nr:response regulator transcription factor [Lacunisphaera sp.]
MATRTNHAPRPKLAIIEHSRVKAELLGSFLASRRGFEVVGVERDAVAGQEMVGRVNPDLVFASLVMPDFYATGMIAGLREVTAAPIIGTITHCNEYLAYALTQVRCHGVYWDAVDGLDELLRLVDRVRQGQTVISASVLREQATWRRNPNYFPKMLSRREQDVLICISRALTNEEIGRQLSISPGTVQSHRKMIMEKMGFHGTPKLIDYAMRAGFRHAPLPCPALPEAESDGSRLEPAQAMAG